MRLNKIKNVAIELLIIGAVATPFLAVGQALPNAPIENITDVTGYINKLANWFFAILLVLAVIFLLVAAFMYLTSGGDPEKNQKAKGFLIYAVIAIVIAVLARGIVALIQNFFGVGVQTPSGIR